MENPRIDMYICTLAMGRVLFCHEINVMDHIFTLIAIHPCIKTLMQINAKT